MSTVAGTVITDFGGYDSSHSITLQADGKILVAGNRNHHSDDYDFALARYNPNGTLDTSFSGDGLLTTDFGNSFDIANSITVQADGKILVAGSSDAGGNGFDFALVRYNPNGTLDTTFSGDGLLATNFGNSFDMGSSITVQADGKILVAGSTGGLDKDFALVRYNPNGTLDTTFSDDGLLTTHFRGSDESFSVTVQADGKILLVGSSGDYFSDFALARYNPNGTLDTTFSGDGWLTTDFGGFMDGASSVTVQADGKILVAGSSDAGGNGSDFALARYNLDGTLDTTFSGDGLLTTNVGGFLNSGHSVTMQADGKILVAGSSNARGSFDFALARYNPNGTLDATFSGDGLLTTDLGRSDGISGITVQADGKILVAGSSYTGTDISDFALARYNPNGTLDTTFGSNSPSNASTAQYLVNTFGITLQQAGGWVMQHLNTPQDIYSICANSGITSNMLADVVQPFFPDIVVTGVMVNDWLQASNQPILN